EFILTAEQAGKRLTLDFGGVDYECDIWLNDVKVCHNKGAFERFWTDVSDVCKVGVNTIFVRIEHMPPEFQRYIIGSDGKQSAAFTPEHFVAGNNFIRRTLKGLKSPANLAYDWASNMYTLGIWKDVSLRITDDVRIDWVQVKNDFELLSGKACNASVTVNIEYNSLSEKSVTVFYTFDGEKYRRNFRVCKGDGVLSATLYVGDRDLWWPNGYGKQPLYDVKVEIDGSDTYETHTAFRKIEWTDCEGAPENFEFKYQLVINGLKIRMMGSNYTGPDMMFGRAGRKGEHFIRMAARCNMNYLRFHGGSSGHNEYTFDAADKYGIMISSEYPIGNCCIETDDELLDAYDKTYVNIIKQLRNHPSIIEWGGGNELEWWFVPGADRKGMYRQEKATYSADDTKLFRYTCPVPGSRHSPWTYVPDWHYRLYNLDDIGDNFKIAPNMRFGEFGVGTPANIETWYRDIPEPDRWPIDVENPVLIRKNAVNAVFSPDTWFAMDVIRQLFGMPDCIEDAVKAGQWIGMEGIRYAVGALRAHDGRIGGLSTWDYNEPFPNGAGSYLIDYDGCPVMMYWGMKSALDPVSIHLKYDDLRYEFIGKSYAEIQVTSDDPAFEGELDWSCKFYNRNGFVYADMSGKVRPEYMKTVSLGSVLINPNEAAMFGPAIGIVKLADCNGNIVSEKCYVFGSKGVSEPFRGLLGDQSKYPFDNGGTYNISGIFGGNVSHSEIKLISTDISPDRAEITVGNVSDMPALYVNVRTTLEYQPWLYVERNFISIPPHEQRTFVIIADDDADRTFDLACAGIEIMAFNGNVLTVEPDERVIFGVGRRDFTCHEYSKELTETEKFGRLEKGEKVCYLFENSRRFIFNSPCECRATLVINTCDRDEAGLGTLRIILNGKEIRRSLGKGDGVQKKEPWHAAHPETFVFEFEEETVRSGENDLTVIAENGWFTLDSFVILKQSI
ncbi:MAG: hypothetical protein IKS28_04445, partial [Clostridia bacterium]|nr:hypothetical protein [Clostridia bacterium]